MSDKSAIEWTDATWNPVTGCTKVSPGCAHCYAEAITLRFKLGGPFLPGKSTVRLHPERLRLPLSWKTPRRIFVNSMSDLFHDDVPLEFIQDVFSVMSEAKRHVFQILTKRHERLSTVALHLPWPSNVWVGVSVENQLWADRRIPCLKQVPAAVRFLSCEPLLKPVDLSKHLPGIHWVIVGGESGPRHRRIDPDWVRSIRDQCQAAGVPFFYKQVGGRTPKAGDRLLDGRTWDEMPRCSESINLASASGNSTSTDSVAAQVHHIRHDFALLAADPHNDSLKAMVVDEWRAAQKIVALEMSRVKEITELRCQAARFHERGSDDQAHQIAQQVKEAEQQPQLAHGRVLREVF